MSKTNKAVAKQEQQYENPWLRVAAESGSDTGPLLKFVKGDWKIGDDVIKDGVEYVAHIDQLITGWVKFEGGKVADRVIGKVADNFQPPAREELGDNDKTEWETDDDGDPRDPWTEQRYLPLISVETGELVTYVTGSKGGMGMIGDLCGVYGRQPRNGLLPIIALKTRSYKHKKHGPIKTPDYIIVGWDGGPPKGGNDAPRTSPLQPILHGKAEAVNDTDMDEIPWDADDEKYEKI
jgi:hypothetical protein